VIELGGDLALEIGEIEIGEEGEVLELGGDHGVEIIERNVVPEVEADAHAVETGQGEKVSREIGEDLGQLVDIAQDPETEDAQKKNPNEADLKTAMIKGHSEHLELAAMSEIALRGNQEKMKKEVKIQMTQLKVVKLTMKMLNT